MLTDQDGERIHERIEAATPGPWVHDMVRSQVTSTAGKGRVVAKVATFMKHGTWLAAVQDDANAKFIAHAREDVPALLDDLERANNVIVRLRAENAAAMEVVRKVSDEGWQRDGDEGYYHCPFPKCEGRGAIPYLIEHTADCPVRHARALLAAQHEQQEEGSAE